MIKRISNKIFSSLQKEKFERFREHGTFIQFYNLLAMLLGRLSDFTHVKAEFIDFCISNDLHLAAISIDTRLSLRPLNLVTLL